MTHLTLLDILAVAFFITCIFGYGWLIHHGPLKGTNISAGAQKQRHKWMETMIHRENRMVDLIILSTLSHGNAFFASTAIVIVGALAATIGTGSGIDTLLTDLPFASQTTPAVIHIKLLFLMIIFLVAFFKFAWAFRLTHYTSIMMGALPILRDDNIEECRRHGRRIVQISTLAGEHANGGLHTYYYGIAAFGWFISPWVFMAATMLIVAVLFRREHHSRGHAIISGTFPLDADPPERTETAKKANQ